MAFIQRTGTDTLLRSEKLPAVSIQIDPRFKYVGSTSFILYDVARAEQHHFVVADAQRRIEQLLWFQFEGYLETNNHQYRYPSSMRTMTLGGLEFLHDADVLNIDEDYRERPTSDSAHVVNFMKEKGYTLEGDTILKRLVWLDGERRNELMIIYAEDLAPTGYRPSDLTEGGPAATEWAAIAQALEERCLSSFKIV